MWRGSVLVRECAKSGDMRELRGRERWAVPKPTLRKVERIETFQLDELHF
jgi:hypothetical protein